MKEILVIVYVMASGQVIEVELETDDCYQLKHDFLIEMNTETRFRKLVKEFSLRCENVGLRT